MITIDDITYAGGKLEHSARDMENIARKLLDEVESLQIENAELRNKLDGAYEDIEALADGRI